MQRPDCAFALNVVVLDTFAFRWKMLLWKFPLKAVLRLQLLQKIWTATLPAIWLRCCCFKSCCFKSCCFKAAVLIVAFKAMYAWTIIAAIETLPIDCSAVALKAAPLLYLMSSSGALQSSLVHLLMRTVCPGQMSHWKVVQCSAKRFNRASAVQRGLTVQMQVQRSVTVQRIVTVQVRCKEV